MKLMKAVGLPPILCITLMMGYVDLTLASSDSQAEDSGDPMLKPYNDEEANLEGRARSPLSCDEQRLTFGTRMGGLETSSTGKEEVSTLLEGQSTDSGGSPPRQSQGSESTDP